MCQTTLLWLMLVTNIITIGVLFWFIRLYKTKSEKYERTLFLQSRHTAISDMLSSIIHQWREPLGAVGAIQSGVMARVMFGQTLDNEFLLESTQTSTNILSHLSETIETFYGFIKNKNEAEGVFRIKSTLDTIKKIMSYSLEKSGITFTCNLEGDYILKGCENEFSQVLVNIIANDRDILVRKTAVEQRNIDIDVCGVENECVITIKDNAGGITLTPIDKVFEQSVSSKGGSGIGLYIAKNIIENNFHGTLHVANQENGAVFTIKLPHNGKTDEKTNSFNVQLSHKTKMISQIIELENAENDMRKWADMFSKAHWGIAVSKGRSNYIEIANPAFAAMHGYALDEICDIPSTDFFSPECLYDFAQKIEEAYEDGFVSFDSIRMRKDGSTFPAHLDLTAVKDANGTVLYRMANIKDITDEKRQESALKHINFAINHVSDAVFLIDKDAKFNWVNTQACDSLGYTQEELLGKRVCDVDPEWPMHRWPEFLDTLVSIKKATLIGKHLRKDGTTFPVEIKANYFEYEGIGYNLAIARDITERQGYEEALQKTILQLSHFASAIPGALFVYMIDANGSETISYASNKLYEILGINNNPQDAKEILKTHCISEPSGGEFAIKHGKKGERAIKKYSLFQSQNDGSTLWYGVLFDITKDKGEYSACCATEN